MFSQLMNWIKRASPTQVLLLVSLSFNLILLMTLWLRSGVTPPPAPDEPQPEPVAYTVPSQTKDAGQAPQAAQAEEAAPSGEIRVLSGEVVDNLYQTMTRLVEGNNADLLAAQVSRILRWKLDMSRDLKRGDTFQVAWQPTDDPLSIYLAALSFSSQKDGRTFEAFLFRPQGKDLAQYYDAEAKAWEPQLIPPVIDQYEQITSLLGENRGHKGIDFKAPTGSKVLMPWDGKVLKTNWNFRYNGNCVEVELLGKGLHAFFLHLSQVADGIKVGDILKAGQVVALSGNTGRTTSPHLHYQLEQGGKAVDPLKIHQTVFPSLSGADKERFLREAARLRSLLQGARAAKDG